MTTNRYKEARIARSMTQEELAIAADISVRTVRRLEKDLPVAGESRRAVSSALNIFEEPAKQEWFLVPLVGWEMRPACIAYAIWVLLTPFWIVATIVNLQPFFFVMLGLHLASLYLPYCLAGKFGEKLWARRELVMVVGSTSGIIAFVGSAWLCLDQWFYGSGLLENPWARIGVSASIVTVALILGIRTEEGRLNLWNRAAQVVFSLGLKNPDATVVIAPLEATPSK